MPADGVCVEGGKDGEKRYAEAAKILQRHREEKIFEREDSKGSRGEGGRGGEGQEGAIALQPFGERIV
jgi:hypothetical protein